jgi:hypothetical protein
MSLELVSSDAELQVANPHLKNLAIFALLLLACLRLD